MIGGSLLRMTRAVQAVPDDRGLVTEFQTQGEYPMFGNDDDRVDSIASSLVSDFLASLRKHPRIAGPSTRCRC